MNHPVFTRVLVVEDVETLALRLQQVLAEPARTVKTVGTVALAIELLDRFRPELVVADVLLPDGTAIDLVQHALAQDALPAFVAISGAAGPDATFRLAQLGVRAFLKKPIDTQALHAAVELASRQPPSLAEHLRASVGQRPVREVEDEVRRVMVQEALARSGGSRRAAARLLSVSRQLLQHILRDSETA
jgi:DNA-binding NtrC family response regulator